MNTKLKSINQLAIPTWEWLHINSTDLVWDGIPAEIYDKDPMISCPEGVKHDTAVPGLNPELVPEGLRGTVRYVSEYANHVLHVEIPEGWHANQPVVLEYFLDSGSPALVNRLHVTAGKNSDVTIVLRYNSRHDAAYFHAGYTTMDIRQGACVKFVSVQTLGTASKHADAVQAAVGSGAHIDLLLAELGAVQSAASADLALEGKGAAASLDALYTGTGISGKDLNYRIEFRGEETEGQITARGALSGKARKVLKSAIDFKTGACGAKGQEEESVLVLSDQVSNQSTPLLLCGEDDVEGQHATNIGHPDKDKLYYLMSRGFSEQEAKQLLVEASLAPMLAKIPNDSLREDMTSLIREVVYDGETL